MKNRKITILNNDLVLISTSLPAVDSAMIWQCGLLIRLPLWAEISCQLFDELTGRFRQTVHVTRRMNPLYFGESLTFRLAPP